MINIVKVPFPTPTMYINELFWIIICKCLIMVVRLASHNNQLTKGFTLSFYSACFPPHCFLSCLTSAFVLIKHHAAHSTAVLFRDHLYVQLSLTGQLRAEVQLMQVTPCSNYIEANLSTILCTRSKFCMLELKIIFPVPCICAATHLGCWQGPYKCPVSLKVNVRIIREYWRRDTDILKYIRQLFFWTHSTVSTSSRS